MTAILVYALMVTAVSFLVAREFLMARQELRPAMSLRGLNAEYKAECERQGP